MVAAKYGKGDPDLGSRVGRKGKTKEVADKALLKASQRISTTGQIGGISNRTTSPSSRKSGKTDSI